MVVSRERGVYGIYCCNPVSCLRCWQSDFCTDLATQLGLLDSRQDADTDDHYSGVNLWPWHRGRYMLRVQWLPSRGSNLYAPLTGLMTTDNSISHNYIRTHKKQLHFRPMYRMLKNYLCTWRLQYNHQVHRYFLITLYFNRKTSVAGHKHLTVWHFHAKNTTKVTVVFLSNQQYVALYLNRLCQSAFLGPPPTGSGISLTFRHCASCILGQAFHYSPENAFYIFNQQIYFIIWYLLDRASLILII